MKILSAVLSLFRAAEGHRSLRLHRAIVTSPCMHFTSCPGRYHSSSAFNLPANFYDEIELPPNAISWYPGHIAKAERELTEYLKKVDVVIEVRDARIPMATSHPLVPTWVGKSKPLLVAINRIDQISPTALKEWKNYFAKYPPYAADGEESTNSRVYFVNGKNGDGIAPLRKQALKAGKAINERRIRRGMQPRAVRAMVIGYPNVGKSALINRLLHRKLAKSFNKPGVTRTMQWIRLGDRDDSAPEDTIELLDSPGIIPATQVSPINAVKLAICNDIGAASYDRVSVAIAMCDILRILHKHRKGYVNVKLFQKRLKQDLMEHTGDHILHTLTEEVCQGNSISGADKLLAEYRKGLLGLSSLECPPVIVKGDDETLRAKAASGVVGHGDDVTAHFDEGHDEEIREEERQEEVDFDEENYDFEDDDSEFELTASGEDDEAQNSHSVSTSRDHVDEIIDDASKTQPRSPGTPRKKRDSLFHVDISAGAGKYDGW